MYEEYREMVISIASISHRFKWNVTAYRSITIATNDDCAICLNPMSKLRLSQMRSCSHVFHTECISKWYAQDNVCTCPMCRIVS
jgi:hypothetical protein